MDNEDRRILKKKVASMVCDNRKEIELHGGAGMVGIKDLKVEWRILCQRYFDRYYRHSNVIVMPSGGDMIMNSLSFLCSDSNSRGFVFKNYDIAKHLAFLGYNKASLKKAFGAPLMGKSIPYVAYIEKRKEIFICEKVSNYSNMNQCLKNIAVLVKYFLTLYDREIYESGVTVIGLLIREKKKQGEFVVCNFCDLFSLSYEDFESPATFKERWNSIETYEGWWDLANSEMQKTLLNNLLFNDLAAQILCFMAVQEKGLPTIGRENNLHSKQTYFIYTPHQMDIHYSDAKHVVIQGSYGSGKSILGLKKLELISKSLGEHEKIMYVNFDSKSSLHLLMERNLTDFARISPRKIKNINSLQDIIESPKQSIYVFHNSAGEYLSAIIEKTLRLNMNKNVNMIIEEYDGETLSHDEAKKISKLVEGSNLMESNIILLAQPLMKKRTWNIGNTSYKRETCMFRELGNTFDIVKLEETLRCSNEIFKITKSTQNFVRNTDSIFNTKLNQVIFKQQQNPEDNTKHMFPPCMPEANYPEMEVPTDKKVSKLSLDFSMDLDQAFQRCAPIRSSKAVKSKIVSKFGFLCEPKQGVDIKGMKPKLVEFSEDIDLSSDIAVISLALVLKEFIEKNKTMTLLHMDEQPQILRRAIQLVPNLVGEGFSYTENIEQYLQKNKQSKMIFCSNIRGVYGMEFDHVVIVASQSEYYLKFYLPQAISRCAFDLNLVLLPKDKMESRKSVLQKLLFFFSRNRNRENKVTVANIIENLKRECLVKQMLIAECKECGNNRNCYGISNEINNMETFLVHTHSDQYQEQLSYLAECTELEEERYGSDNSALTK